MNEMKIYKKLTVPNDTAWDRKSIWRRLPISIKEFFVGVKNIIKWMPTIYNDRDWDSGYIYNILQKKIEFQRSEIVNANRHTRVEFDNRDMTLALNLIERIREDYYGMEYLDYQETNIEFVPVDDRPDVSRLKRTLISENYDDYLKKYPSTVKTVLKMHDENLDKERLCFYVAHQNHLKAKRILFRLLEERLDWWWD